MDGSDRGCYHVTAGASLPHQSAAGTLRCLQKEMATYRYSQTMSHIVESCPLTQLAVYLGYTADEDAVSWLTSYGS